tara:strand:+ start:95 stop:523 length:429 start_codon:yes stop_codon:yes gene_type:complete
MKSFKTYLKEVSLGTGSAGISSEVEPDFHRIDQEDVRARVNTWLSATCAMEFRTVDAALNQIAGKIEQIGLQFERAEAAGDSGSLRLPLTQFGGRQGKDIETRYDDKLNDDGISHRTESPLVMSIDYEKMPAGGFRVTGQIQ